MNRVFRESACIAGAIALAIFVISAVPLLLIQFWHYPINTQPAPALQETGRALWQYLLYEKSDVLPNLPSGIRERRHMLDVKRLLNSLEIISLFAGLSGIFILIIYRNIEHLIRRTALLGISSVLLSGLCFLALGFDKVFIFIHRLLFTQGTWWFNEQNPLILLFPVKYFIELALISGTLILVIFIFTLVYSQKRIK